MRRPLYMDAVRAKEFDVIDKVSFFLNKVFYVFLCYVFLVWFHLFLLQLEGFFINLIKRKKVDVYTIGKLNKIILSFVIYIRRNKRNNYVGEKQIMKTYQLLNADADDNLHVSDNISSTTINSDSNELDTCKKWFRKKSDNL